MSRIAHPIFAVTLAVLASTVTEAGTLKVMHTFQGGSDGAESWAAPIMDAAGNFYGTTAFGGNGAGCPVASHGGCGTVYKIASDGTESVLHAFRGNDDGRYPVGGLTLDEDGNLYGTTQLGGSSDCQLMGCGTVFKIAPNGDETILHAFRDDDVDAAGPVTGLVRDSSGNLYGAGLGGGPAHAGAIFKIATDNTYSIVHTFTGTAKQQGNPNSLMIDRFDNIYGTSGYRAEYEYCVHCGTIFKLSRTGVFSTVHVFPKDTPMPDGALVKDSAGNLYGTTYAGGPTVCGCGTIFKLANDGSLTTLYSFQGGTDGRWPLGGMAMDRSGNLYGATAAGGTACGSGCGTLFKLDAGGTESVVYRMFRKKGASLVSGIMRGPGGVLYGTARIYGGGEGTFFKIKP